MPQCGDGVKDRGEVCDGSEDCDNQCQFVAGSLGSFGRNVLFALVIIVGASTGGFFIVKRGGFRLWPPPETKAPSGKGVSLDDVPLTDLEMPWHHWEL